MAQVHFIALSERGIQDINKDSFCAEKIGNFHVFAVADGLAGHPSGRTASDIAISSLKSAVHIKVESPRTTLENAVHDADILIRQHPNCLMREPDGYMNYITISGQKLWHATLKDTSIV